MTQLENTAPVTDRTGRPHHGPLRSVLATAPVLAAFWLILSGHYTPLLLTFGLASVALVTWLMRRAGLDHHSLTTLFVLRLSRYFLWLCGQIFVTACAVVRRVWSPRPDLRPVVATTPMSDVPLRSQVVYANSITLTPGTLALDVHEDRIEVHSLQIDDIEGIADTAMLDRVRRTEGRR